MWLPSPFVTACLCLCGHLEQAARKINVAKFRANKVQFLIVTDVAARGIDIPLLDNVVNYGMCGRPVCVWGGRVGWAAPGAMRRLPARAGHGWRESAGVLGRGSRRPAACMMGSGGQECWRDRGRGCVALK